ncbi:MAG: potassium-transporting ATPase subunit C [Gemmataceae bacterium]
MKHLRANVLLLGLTLVICSVLYPAVLLGIAQGVFPDTASGSLIAGPGGSFVGSRLIAQEFKGDGWFQPRPSAADYNAAAAGASNLGASNPKLRERVVKQLGSRNDPIPADAVTTSGGGLDPHITLRNARDQLPRVAAVRAAGLGKGESEVRMAIDAMLSAAAFTPLGGLAGGELLVNVLEVNLAVSEQFPASTTK